jgi:CRISPR-associated protein Cst1
MEIRIELSDWLLNAGVVGLMNIFDSAEIPYDTSIPNCIKFSSEDLSNFSEYYFKYFNEKYAAFTSWNRAIGFCRNAEQITAKEMDEDKLEKLNKNIEAIKKLLQSNSYVNTYPLIKDMPYDIKNSATNLKKVTKKKNQTFSDIQPSIESTVEAIRQITACLTHPETQKYIIARNVTYEIIQQFWEGVSFLHKKANTKDMYEECETYFVTPVLQHIEEKLNEKKYEKYKYTCFNCDNKFSKLASAFELTWINKTGVDSARKSSHFWNYTSDAYVCPICNLVYACVPAGFNVINGKGIFVNQNSHTKELKSINNLVLQKDIAQGIEDLEEQSYYKLLDILDQVDIRHHEKGIQNIQIVKMDSSNSRRPYTFNVLSKEKLLVIKHNRKNLQKLVGKVIKEGKEYISLYQEVLKRLYNNQNQFDLLYYLFRRVLKGEYKQYPVLQSILLINNSQFKGGKEQVHYKKIKDYQNYGYTLRESYLDKKSDNKIPGITYRLLNALKLKNPHRFMDTLINSYMYQKKQVPMDFIEALQDEMKFQTIGYAFVLGLQGEHTNKEVEEEIKDGE